MKKKKYEAPQMKAYQVKPASIICTSTQANFQSYEEDDDTFSGNWYDY